MKGLISIRNHASRSWFRLAVVVLCPKYALPACQEVRGQRPNGLVKFVPYNALPKRLQFSAPAPKSLPGNYKLYLVELAWISGTIYQDKHSLPSRQAMHLLYRRSADNERVDVIIQKRIPYGSQGVDAIYSNQNFITARLQPGNAWYQDIGHTRDIDYLIMASRMKNSDGWKVMDLIESSPVIR